MPTAKPAAVTDEAQAFLEHTADAVTRLKRAVGLRVVGQESVVDLMLITLFCRGHALVVGVPGLAKTLMVASMAQALDLTFGRVQFTPDLLPADITGTDVLQEEEVDGRVVRRLSFLAGPVFANLVLADEINRTPPKTQSALLQAMQERAVTVGTTTHPLPDPFQVFATRNPIEQEGTYPLPEAQLDRFLFEIHVEYPSEADERTIAERNTSASLGPVGPVLDGEDLRRVSSLLPRIPITQEAVHLAVRIARATRPQDSKIDEVAKYVRYGAGPRASQALVLSAKARAVMQGRAAADVEDVRAMGLPVLRHRIVLGYRAEADGLNAEAIVAAVLRGSW